MHGLVKGVFCVVSRHERCKEVGEE